MSTPDDAPPAVPAATVVLLRDEPAGLTTLMLHRSSAGAFGGMWVFPGGRVDDGDRHPDDADDEPAARRAAVREAVEECALLLEPHELVPFSHWTPPPETPRRFATWFFVARASDGEVVVDGHEIHDHAWLSPTEVLDRRARGEIDLAPPTFVTLADLATAATVDEAIAMATARSPLARFASRFARTGDAQIVMWEGDVAYDSGDADVEGPRHRLWMRESAWTYERT